jgi:transposase-like protein
MATIKHRKNYQSDFKAKVTLEAVKGRLTINEISKQFGVHPNQISKWKKQFLESLPQIFDNSKKSPVEQKRTRPSLAATSEIGSVVADLIESNVTNEFTIFMQTL